MRRTSILTVAASAIALALPAPASADPGRVDVVTYNFTAVGQGDVGGVCFVQDPNSVIPPELWSCVQLPPSLGAVSVDVTVIDNSGVPVYFSVKVGNQSFTGCGTLQNVPIPPPGPGGAPPGPITVFPWLGPGLGPGFPAEVDPCIPGSTDLTGGTITFTFHDHP